MKIVTACTTLLVVISSCVLIDSTAVAFQSSAFVAQSSLMGSRLSQSCSSPIHADGRHAVTMGMPGFFEKLRLGRKQGTEEETTFSTSTTVLYKPPTANPSEETSQEDSGIAKEEEKEDKTKNLIQQIKDAGTAGAISLFLWEGAFWIASVPVCILGYQKVTGHWPDLSNGEDLQKLGAEAFAFVNFARFAFPLRIGLALSTTPWIEENVVEKFLKKNDGGDAPNGTSL